MITEITNEALGLIPGTRRSPSSSNWYFAIVCSIVLAIVAAVLTERIIEPRLGPWKPAGDHVAEADRHRPRRRPRSRAA